MSDLRPFVWRKTSISGLVKFLPGTVGPDGKMASYVPCAMPEARALACAQRMAQEPREAPGRPQTALQPQERPFAEGE